MGRGEKEDVERRIRGACELGFVLDRSPGRQTLVVAFLSDPQRGRVAVDDGMPRVASIAHRHRAAMANLLELEQLGSKPMKTILVVGSLALLASVVAGCGDSGVLGGKAVTDDNKGAIVGVWNCITKTGDGMPNMSDSKTFGADGFYFSSRFPEGKRYPYRLEGDKLIVVIRSEDWTETVKRLTADALEYANEKSGMTTSVSCQK